MTLALTTPELSVDASEDGHRLLLVDDHRLLVETMQVSDLIM